MAIAKETSTVVSMDDYRAKAPSLRRRQHQKHFGHVGETALAMAVARWNEADAPQPLFTDRYAPLFVDAAYESGWRPRILTLSPDGLSRIDPMLSARIQALHDYAACRTRFFDEFFERANENGIRQMVFLSSALDARAWRLQWPAGTTVFDVDCPNTLDFKISSLWAANFAPSCDYRPVSVELRAEWGETIRKASFNPDLPTAWSVEGPLAYLPGPHRDQLLDKIGQLSAPGSRLAAESVSASKMNIRLRQRRIRETQEAAAASGHTFLRETRSLWNTTVDGDLAGELRSRGWHASEAEAEDLMAMYGRAPSAQAFCVAPSSVFIRAGEAFPV